MIQTIDQIVNLSLELLGSIMTELRILIAVTVSDTVNQFLKFLLQLVEVVFKTASQVFDVSSVNLELGPVLLEQFGGFSVTVLTFSGVQWAIVGSLGMEVIGQSQKLSSIGRLVYCINVLITLWTSLEFGDTVRLQFLSEVFLHITLIKFSLDRFDR